MNQLQQTVLFEIPIYKHSSKVFERKYWKFIQRKSKLVLEVLSDLGKDKETQDVWIKKTARQYEKEKIWKYNQIIGYIKVYYSESSIWFDLYMPDYEERIFIFSKTKHYVSLRQLSGCHFSVLNTNNEIAKKIKGFLMDIKTNYLRDCYVDLSTFNSLYLHLDYLSIFNKSS